MPQSPRQPILDEVLLGDNLDLLARFVGEAFQLIYIDPPFNTGKSQTRKTLETVPDGDGDRTGFQGRRYKTRLLATLLARKVFLDIIPGAAHGRNFYRFRSRLSKAVSRLCKSGPWPSV